MIKRVIVIAVLLLLPSFITNKSEAARGQRTDVAVFAAVVGGGSDRHHMLTTNMRIFDRTPAEPGTRRASTH
jgi:hypothetical protein